MVAAAKMTEAPECNSNSLSSDVYTRGWPERPARTNSGRHNVPEVVVSDGLLRQQSIFLRVGTTTSIDKRHTCSREV